MNPIQHKHLALIGMMGSGKSSVGRILNDQHQLPFVDIDYEIQRRTCLSIKELFATKGETYFRQLEHEMIKETAEKEVSSIISTGGGAVVDKENRSILWQNSFVVYLKAEVSTLLERLSHDTQRPLLQEGNAQEILQDLLKSRSEFYEHAHLTLQVDRMNPRLVASRIWSHFSKRK